MRLSAWCFGLAIASATLAITLVGSPSPGAESPDGVPRAQCGPGSSPETGLQGQVPRADRDSGRSQQGYRCNLTLIGQYQGDGATWVQPSYDHCSYLGSYGPGPTLEPAGTQGVHVVDVADERHPAFSTALNSTAMMLGTWESLKVDPVHGYLAATGVPLAPGAGALAFDIYDIKTDCAHPRLLNGLAGSLTIPTPVLSHEAAFSPDGNTYYVLAAGGGGIFGIDVSNPQQPRLLGSASVGLLNHGASISPDGRTMYGVTMVPSGVQILDISDFQDRKPLPQVRQIGAVTWNDGLLGQHTLNFTSGGRPYLYAIDEGGGGGVRLVDIADPTQPKVVREYRLEINRPENTAAATSDTGSDGAFGYDSHYCSIDRQTDPTMLACGYFQSGVRLFDVRNPMSPRELAYYNPPAQVGRQAGTPNALVNSAHAWAVSAPHLLDPNMFGGSTVVDSLHPTMNTDWCSSPPTFKPDNTLWVTCQDNGFMVLRYRPFTNSATAAPSPTATVHADRSDDDSDSDRHAHRHHHHGGNASDDVPRVVEGGLSGRNSVVSIVLAGLASGSLFVGSALARQSRQ